MLGFLIIVGHFGLPALAKARELANADSGWHAAKYRRAHYSAARVAFGGAGNKNARGEGRPDASPYPAPGAAFVKK